MSKLTFSCKQATRLSSQAMEQPLTPSERLLLGLHLVVCRGCRNFRRQIDFLRRLSGKLPEVLEQDAD